MISYKNAFVFAVCFGITLTVALPLFGVEKPPPPPSTVYLTSISVNASYDPTFQLLTNDWTNEVTHTLIISFNWTFNATLNNGGEQELKIKDTEISAYFLSQIPDIDPLKISDTSSDGFILPANATTPIVMDIPISFILRFPDSVEGFPLLNSTNETITQQLQSKIVTLKYSEFDTNEYALKWRFYKHIMRKNCVFEELFGAPARPLTNAEQSEITIVYYNVAISLNEFLSLLGVQPTYDGYVMMYCPMGKSNVTVSETSVSLDLPFPTETSISLDFPESTETSISLDLPLPTESSVSLDIPFPTESSVSLDLPEATESSVSLDIPESTETSVSLDFPLPSEIFTDIWQTETPDFTFETTFTSATESVDQEEPQTILVNVVETPIFS